MLHQTLTSVTKEFAFTFIDFKMDIKKNKNNVSKHKRVPGVI